LDQCETLAFQTDKSKALHRTLAAAFDRLEKPFEAFDHMVHCRDLMETSTSLKESIIVKHQIALKKLIGQSDRDKNSPASNAQVKESPVQAKHLEGQLEAVRSDLSALQKKIEYLEAQNKNANKCCKGLNTRLEDVERLRKEAGSLSEKVESLCDVRG
jgi:predicted RNase H-like nuclease (RuvC/YqgF family)